LWCWMDMQGDESNPAPPRPDPLRGWAMIAPSSGYYGDCKHMSALGEYPQSRISIHRCYKLYRGGAERGAWRGDCRGIGTGLCTILDVDFREFQFYAL
jgi:hypothetical protein